MDETQAPGLVSETQPHHWPCAHFFSFASDRGPCTCGAGRPAAPAAEADLRDATFNWLFDLYGAHVDVRVADADDLLAGPLQRLTGEAAEARRLRETVARVSALLNGALMIPQAQVRRALDGEGTDG